VHINGRTPGEMMRNMRIALLKYGQTVKSEDWQGKDNPPEFLELIQVSGDCYMMHSLDKAAKDINPLLPWANQHFEERIQGFATNPDPSHVNWLKGNENYKMNEEKFSHTYSERLWPKDLYTGIRFAVGDLSTAVELLKTKPSTRQLVVPMYMHEDLTASLEGERVPCSLSWNFILRQGLLHCTYTMRSTDAVRHLHNDLYFANLLTLYLIEQSGIKAKPGNLSFTSTNLHCFENDKYTLKRLIEGKYDYSI